MTKRMQRKLRLYSSTDRFLGAALLAFGCFIGERFSLCFFFTSRSISLRIFGLEPHPGGLCVLFLPFAVHHGFSRICARSILLRCVMHSWVVPVRHWPKSKDWVLAFVSFYFCGVHQKRPGRDAFLVFCYSEELLTFYARLPACCSGQMVRKRVLDGQM
jgi:hypothetical protein